MNEKKIILEELEEYINKVSYLKEDINVMKKNFIVAKQNIVDQQKY